MWPRIWKWSTDRLFAAHILAFFLARLLSHKKYTMFFLKSEYRFFSNIRHLIFISTYESFIIFENCERCSACLATLMQHNCYDDTYHHPRSMARWMIVCLTVLLTLPLKLMLQTRGHQSPPDPIRQKRDITSRTWTFKHIGWTKISQNICWYDRWLCALLCWCHTFIRTNSYACMIFC